jgi:hypothetical protein
MVCSNLLLLLSLFMLQHKELLKRYWIEGVGIVVALWQSCVYHACYAEDIRWCPAETPQVLHGWDVMASQLTLVWFITPFIDQFTGWRSTYASVMIMTTHFFMTLFSDDNIATSVVLTTVAVAAFVYIAVYKVDPDIRTLSWRIRFLLTLAIGIFAVIAYILDDGLWHARWHAAAASALCLTYSLLLRPNDARLPAFSSIATTPS